MIASFEVIAVHRFHSYWQQLLLSVPPLPLLLPIITKIRRRHYSLVTRLGVTVVKSLWPLHHLTSLVTPADCNPANGPSEPNLFHPPSSLNYSPSEV